MQQLKKKLANAIDRNRVAREPLALLFFAPVAAGVVARVAAAPIGLELEQRRTAARARAFDRAARRVINREYVLPVGDL